LERAGDLNALANYDARGRLTVIRVPWGPF
jgi:hypothetical protein